LFQVDAKKLQKGIVMLFIKLDGLGDSERECKRNAHLFSEEKSHPLICESSDPAKVALLMENQLAAMIISGCLIFSIFFGLSNQLLDFPNIDSWFS
jgi:hypothetical protein